MIRLRPELLERIQATARSLGMSMNAFIVKTLENVETFPSESRFNEIERRIKLIEERIDALESSK